MLRVEQGVLRMTVPKVSGYGMIAALTPTRPERCDTEGGKMRIRRHVPPELMCGCGQIYGRACVVHANLNKKQRFQIKAICNWLGNSPQVAEKHYLMAMQEEFDRAISGPPVIGRANAPQIAPQTMADTNGNPAIPDDANCRDSVKDAIWLLVSQDALPFSYPARTLPHYGKTRGKHNEAPELTPESTPAIELLSEVWKSLGDELKDKVRKLTRNPQRNG